MRRGVLSTAVSPIRDGVCVGWRPGGGGAHVCWQGLELRILYVLRRGCERYGVNERNDERNGAEGSGGAVNRLAGEALLKAAMERSGIAALGRVPKQTAYP